MGVPGRAGPSACRPRGPRSDGRRDLRPTSGDVRDVGVPDRHALRRVEDIGDPAEARSEHDHQLRAGEPGVIARRADDVGRPRDSSIQLRSVRPVAQVRRWRRALHALQQLALLGLVLLRCDEPLVAQVGEPLERCAHVIGGTRGGRLGRGGAGVGGGGGGAASGAAAGASSYTATRSDPARGGIGLARSIGASSCARW